MALFFNAPLSFIARAVAAAFTGSGIPFQGTTSGYTAGGDNLNTIDKFPFASDGNATDVGDLTGGTAGTSSNKRAGNSSTTFGYVTGALEPPSTTEQIQKFPFASNNNATDVADMSVPRRGVTGQTLGGTTAYISGGWDQPNNSIPSTNVIEKFPFATEGNSTDIADLAVARAEGAGQSSTVSGYSSGGVDQRGSSPTIYNVIDKFPFASDANATDVGDLTIPRLAVAGQSSADNGYSSGGGDPALSPFALDTIDKFPFASDANATDVGNLLYTLILSGAGQSSTSSGYTSGGAILPSDHPGISPGGQQRNEIQKFPFASDANATDVGDLTAGRHSGAGNQV